MTKETLETFLRTLNEHFKLIQFKLLKTNQAILLVINQQTKNYLVMKYEPETGVVSTNSRYDECKAIQDFWALVKKAG